MKGKGQKSENEIERENFTQNRHNRINVDKINKLFDRIQCEAGKENERE